MKTPLYKQYQNKNPLGVLSLSNFGGIAILDLINDGETAITAWDFGTGYQKITRCKVHYSTGGRGFIRKGQGRYYLDQFMRIQDGQAMKYIFKTCTTMKDYNNKKWRIGSNIITEKRIEAENLTAALNEYRATIEEKHYITISDHAMRTKQPMYIDQADGEPLQVGFIITGKTEFEDRDNYKWSMQYIDLWVEILTVSRSDF